MPPIITKELAALPCRADDAHKGSVGRIAIIGGCSGEVTMVGAVALAANAAMRSGAGLVRLFVPEALVAPALVLAPTCTACRHPRDAAGLLSAMFDFGADVAVIGPGLGESLPAEAVVEFIRKFPGPILVDADGLNRLSESPGFAAAGDNRVILTPHPGEAARLLASKGLSDAIGTDPTSRRQAALALTEQYRCIVALKGRGTVVTNGERLYVNETGNSGMATGGSGNVLTGVIAALIGQRMAPFEAAVLGVYLHGLAGDFAAEEYGRLSMTAEDIISFLPVAISEHDTQLEP